VTLRVLFVDDEPAVLDGLRFRMRRARDRWQASYADGGRAALELLGRQAFDVVVTDIRMPGVDGVQVLERTKQLHASALRVVLSGHAEADALSRVSTLAHRVLGKPCDFAALQAVLEGAEAWRGDDETTDVIRAKISWIGHLPSPPTTYLELCQLEHNGRSGTRGLVEVVERDPALATRVLQLANSAMLGVARRVDSIEQAVALVGVELLKSLALASRLSGAASASAIAPADLAREQRHSLASAAVARRLAVHAAPGRGDEAFAAGLLHDVGRLVLAMFGPVGGADTVARGPTGDTPDIMASERARFGLDHSAAGAHLLQRWGLPSSLVEVVASHHEPVSEAGLVAADPLVTLVHVGSLLAEAPDLELPKVLLDRIDRRDLIEARELARRG
jgi:HD-like signal output (HDOD) protein/CheY-like chemotaxis protein